MFKTSQPSTASSWKSVLAETASFEVLPIRRQPMPPSGAYSPGDVGAPLHDGRRNLLQPRQVGQRPLRPPLQIGLRAYSKVIHKLVEIRSERLQQLRRVRVQNFAAAGVSSGDPEGRFPVVAGPDQLQAGLDCDRPCFGRDVGAEEERRPRGGCGRVEGSGKSGQMMLDARLPQLGAAQLLKQLVITAAQAVLLQHAARRQIAHPDRRIAKSRGQNDMGSDAGREQPRRHPVMPRQLGLRPAQAVLRPLQRIPAAPLDPKAVLEAAGRLPLDDAKPSRRIRQNPVVPEATRQMIGAEHLFRRIQLAPGQVCHFQQSSSIDELPELGRRRLSFQHDEHIDIGAGRQLGLLRHRCRRSSQIGTDESFSRRSLLSDPFGRQPPRISDPHSHRPPFFSCRAASEEYLPCGFKTRPCSWKKKPDLSHLHHARSGSFVLILRRWSSRQSASSASSSPWIRPLVAATSRTPR
ncbi:hypothetical protein BN871_EK_00060 [Paenibacillus sp. P22]|nr:hypothetical protein BN871_EK_00060 [Paenibacillus sp. P22]